MSSNFTSTDIQVSINPSPVLKSFQSAGNIYMTRKDIPAIRDQLQILIPDKEYWKAFALYIHGKCSRDKFDKIIAEYLISDELKNLHNELLRRIIFNAHFSCIPPPGISIPKSHKNNINPSSNHDVRRHPKPLTLNLCTAYDLGFIPSVKELSIRLAQLLSRHQINADQEAVKSIYLALRNYISILLKRSYEIAYPSPSCMGGKTISTHDLLYALQSNEKLSSTLSFAVITKYSSNTDKT